MNRSAIRSSSLLYLQDEILRRISYVMWKTWLNHTAPGGIAPGKPLAPSQNVSQPSFASNSSPVTVSVVAISKSEMHVTEACQCDYLEIVKVAFSPKLIPSAEVVPMIPSSQPVNTC